MERSTAELTAYCGLYCGDCIHYRSKAAELAQDLLKELQTTGFDTYANIVSTYREKMKDYESFRRVLEGIGELRCEEPCRVGGGCPTFTCVMLACCRRKGIEGCWECDEYETCNGFDSLMVCHGDNPRKNLRKIKELGTENWAAHREKFFIWE